MIHVGVVGTGFGRAVHIPAFRRVAGVELAGVASRDSQRAQAVAAEAGIPHAFECWQDLVDSPDVDVISVATPPAAHASIVLAATQAGKLVSKPPVETSFAVATPS